MTYESLMEKFLDELKHTEPMRGQDLLPFLPDDKWTDAWVRFRKIAYLFKEMPLHEIAAVIHKQDKLIHLKGFYIAAQMASISPLKYGDIMQLLEEQRARIYRLSHL